MRKSLFIRFIISFALLISVMVPLTPETKAATVYTGVVKVSSASVKSSASSSSKTVKKLKKGSIVNVYEKTKSGWSLIYFNKKKAYIPTKYLKLSKKISFLLDKSKIYTYENPEGGTISLKYSSNKDGWNVWKTRDGKKVLLTERESKYALEEKEGGQVLEQLSYPLYVGKVVKYINETTKITSLTKTVKTTAGTFNNCVEMQQLRSGRTAYFAPNVGLVQIKKGSKIEMQLAQRKTESQVKAEENKVKDLIHRNTKNLESENVTEYMKDIVKEKRNDATMIAIYEELFRNTDIKYEIQGIKFLSMTDKEVIVEVKTKMTATYVAPGYTFKNQVSTAVHSIVKEDGKYVFSKSGVTDIDYQ